MSLPSQNNSDPKFVSSDNSKTLTLELDGLSSSAKYNCRDVDGASNVGTILLEENVKTTVSLDDLNSVEVDDPQTSEILTFDGSNWTNQAQIVITPLYEYLESAGSSSTSGVLVKLDFTTSNLAPADYELKWYCEFSNTDASTNTSVQIDDVTGVPATLAIANQQGTDIHPFGGFKRLASVSGVKQFQMKISVPAFTGNIQGANISIQRV